MVVRFRGWQAADRLGSGSVEIHGRAVVVAAGPWTASLSGADPARLPHAFALNIEVGRRLAEVAAGVRAPTGAAEDPIIGGRRFLFLAPQERTTLLGTWYAPADGRKRGGAGGARRGGAARGVSGGLPGARARRGGCRGISVGLVAPQGGTGAGAAGRAGRPAACLGAPTASPTDERHHPYNNRTIYGAAKAFNEGLLRSFAEMYRLILSHCVTSTSMVLGWTFTVCIPKYSFDGWSGLLLDSPLSFSGTDRRRWTSCMYRTSLARTCSRQSQP